MMNVEKMHHDPTPIQKFLVYYEEWKKTHKSIQQVSSPRSGGHWLSWIIEGCSGRLCYDNFRDDEFDFPDNAYFNNHWLICDLIGDKYVFLVRDPRSIMWSRVEWAREYGKDQIDSIISWNHFANVYRGHFDRYLNRNTIIVQYERICLFPVEEITRVMKFIGYDIKNDIQEVIDKLDARHRDHHPNLPFKTGYDRYLACCLKWQNEEYDAGHRDFIWKNLGDIMIHYGYTKDGHAQKLFNI